jgi:cytoskeletal protein CcmA (bactofilin family)
MGSSGLNVIHNSAVNSVFGISNYESNGSTVRAPIMVYGADKGFRTVLGHHAGDITTPPNADVTVTGSVSASGFIKTDTNITASGNIQTTNLSASGDLSAASVTASKDIVLTGSNARIQNPNNMGTILWGASNTSTIAFVSGSTSTVTAPFYFDMKNKKMGVNTLTPSKELTVEGDISASGMISSSILSATTITASKHVKTLAITASQGSKFGTTGGTTSTSHQFYGISGHSNFFLIADKDGEEVMKGSGAVGDGNLIYKFGDNAEAGNGNFFGVDDGNSKAYFTNAGNDGKFGINTENPTGASGLTVRGHISASKQIIVESASFGAKAHSNRTFGLFNVGLGSHHMTSSLVKAGDGYGTIISWGTQHGSVNSGSVIRMANHLWKATDKDTESYVYNLIGVAMDSGSGTDYSHRILTEGVVIVSGTIAGIGSGDSGVPLYISDAGSLSKSPSTTTGDFNRVVGYLLASGSTGISDNVVYFKPDNTWVEVG